ncbi:MAG: hypothetical protein F2737_05975 [Actinobacteria bacterium]|uniref:Unannotated protein n=1 Tax=freshwater metagenome TaxID=449393 RepID=A0A6J6Y7B7_9ZZZZ|nr:hypothetical protein [Actinomycetota bacterium]
MNDPDNHEDDADGSEATGGSFDGSVDVDIEPGLGNKQISVFTRESACLDLVRVTLTGDIFGILATFRDGLHPLGCGPSTRLGYNVLDVRLRVLNPSW